MEADVRARYGIPALAVALAALGLLLALPFREAAALTGVSSEPLVTAVVAGGFVVTGLWVAHLRVGREGHEISLRDVVIVAGLASLAPALYLAVHVLGALLPRLLRRTAPVKVLFNAGLFTAEAGLAIAVTRLVGSGADPASGRGLLAALLAVAAVDLLSAACVTAAIALHTAGAAGRPRLAMQAVGLLTALASAAVGLLGVVLASRERVALPLLGVLLGVLFLAYRSQIRLTEGHDRIEVLYAFTTAAGQALADDTVAHTVLARTRELMSAESVELHLTPGQDQTTALCLTEAGFSTVQAHPAEADAWWTPALAGQPVHRRHADPGAGPDDALAAPLYRDGHVMGALVVVDKMGADATFHLRDAKVFGALAGTASVSLHNARLVDSLRQEALVRERASRHDALTGLLNRAGFQQVVDQCDAGTAMTVLIMDIEGFRDVNDALGQEVGDELLTEVGRRLTDQLSDGVVARLFADEYAVLVPDDPAVAAARVEGALAAPFSIRQARLPVRVRSGAAHRPRHGTSAELLLRRADLALHRAKRDSKRAARFEPKDESSTSQRLALVGDLREALAADQLTVAYQPQLNLRSGRIQGAEALVRWTHEVRGPVFPDIFIPLAESAGLVEELTDVVLRTALRDLSEWRSSGLLRGVAVNISARGLSAELPTTVTRALAAADLPAQALTLELTETAVVSDPDGAAEVLRELSALGCHLSLDDFGTGYSSLSYLRNLPLNEVKVDKSFVMRMVDDRQDEAVVRSTVQLAHDLGMSVVAEGVEDARALQALQDLGCDVVQGYYIARPMAGDRLPAWLREHPQAATALAGGPPPPARFPQPRTAGGRSTETDT